MSLNLWQLSLHHFLVNKSSQKNTRPRLSLLYKNMVSPKYPPSLSFSPFLSLPPFSLTSLLSFLSDRLMQLIQRLYFKKSRTRLWSLAQFKVSCYEAAAAAKSLQSCPTLCDLIDGSPPGFPIPGILQARTLEWVAISFSNAWKWKVKVKSLSPVWLLATPWTAAHQSPPSMGFSRQEYWSGVPVSYSLIPLCLETNSEISGSHGFQGKNGMT